jgi:hypothetical protein
VIRDSQLSLVAIATGGRMRKITDLILRSLQSKRLEGWRQHADSRPSFETRRRRRSSEPD